MDDIFTLFGNSELINLRRDKVAGTKNPYRGDAVMLACERLGRLSMSTERTPADEATLETILKMRSEEERNGDLRYRRDLTIMPLQVMYEIVNGNFAEHFGKPAKTARWNQLIGDWLIVSYGFFADYLEGQRYDERKKLWYEIVPPRPEEATLAATNLATMLHSLAQPPYSKILTERNIGLMQQLYGHLRPHMMQAPLALAYKM